MVLKACQSQQESLSGNDSLVTSNGTLLNGNSPPKPEEKSNEPASKKVSS